MDIDLSDLSAPDLSDLDSADLSDTSDSATPDATSTPDLSTPVPDLTQTQTATPPTTDPYAMDPSQWDQDTRNYAALGDLHCMVDQHVRDYGTLPDSDTMDGFMNQICDTWGTPVTADANPADSPAAPMAASVNQPDALADDNPSQSVNLDQPSPTAPVAPPATPEPAASTDASATPPQPTPPRLAATDTGTMSDATNDVRSSATQNQLAQNEGAQIASSDTSTGANGQSKQEAQQQARVAANEEALKNPNVRAMLDTIGQAEGAKYNTRYGGGTFNDYSKHPALDQQSQTPSGKYQITAQTYKDVSGRLGLTDFSPHTQDIMAVQKLVDRGAIDDIKSGNIDTALPKISHEWSSLPTGPNQSNAYPGQPYKSYDAIISSFKQNLANQP